MIWYKNCYFFYTDSSVQIFLGPLYFVRAFLNMVASLLILIHGCGEYFWILLQRPYAWEM